MSRSIDPDTVRATMSRVNELRRRARRLRSLANDQRRASYAAHGAGAVSISHDRAVAAEHYYAAVVNERDADRADAEASALIRTVRPHVLYLTNA